MIEENKKAFALKLYDIGAIRFGAFRLKLHEKNPDAPLSPIYIDLRILRSFPEVMDMAVDIYAELIRYQKFDMLADIPTAATPIVAVLSHKTRIPMISPRKEEKKHGIKRPIDGIFKEGQVALLVDDLITLADSKLDAISILEENSIRVSSVAVLLDREQGGVEELKRRGYVCNVAYKLKELLRLYLESERINQQQYERTIAYLVGSPS